MRLLHTYDSSSIAVPSAIISRREPVQMHIKDDDVDADDDDDDDDCGDYDSHCFPFVRLHT